MNAKDLERALEVKYLHYQQGWALLREVSVADPIVHQAYADLKEIPWRNHDISNPDYKRLRDITLGSAYLRRIDVLLMRTSTIAVAKVPYERIAVEIKVSRADFFRDTPEKRNVWHSLAHRFAYLTPAGLIKREELPNGCGLLELIEGHSAPDWKVRAPRRTGEPDQFTDKFVSYLARRASDAEAELRRQKVATP